MLMIGVDYHPSFQQIAFFVEETGECGERQLNHSAGEAERFYRELKQRGVRVRVGMEAAGYSRWLERLLAELGFELWIGDPAEINAKRIKARQLLVAILAGGGSPGGSTNQSGVATSVHSPGDASAQEYCQGSDGAEPGGSLVLDVAE
jgi:hypothetical protein